jgi:hypothetical protein
MVVVGGSVGSQSALGAGWTAAPGFVEALNLQRIGLKKLLDDVAVSVIELTTI